MYIYVYIRNQNTKTPKHFFQSPARRTIFGDGFTANHPGELELPEGLVDLKIMQVLNCDSKQWKYTK